MECVYFKEMHYYTHFAPGILATGTFPSLISYLVHPSALSKGYINLQILGMPFSLFSQLGLGIVLLGMHIPGLPLGIHAQPLIEDNAFDPGTGRN